MIRIRGPDHVRRIDDPDVRSLVERRFAEICNGEPFQEEIHGRCILVEPGDTAADLEEECGLPLMSNPFDGARFPEPEFVPICEIIERHRAAYELVLIVNDEGAGSEIFVPRRPGISPALLAMCARFSESAPERTSR